MAGFAARCSGGSLEAFHLISYVSDSGRAPYGIQPTSRDTDVMARETIYLVQAYRSGRGTRLIADQPISCKSEEHARRAAERLGASKAGVVAFSTSGDPELGEYDDEPRIIFKQGRLPAQFAGD